MEEHKYEVPHNILEKFKLFIDFVEKANQEFKTQIWWRGHACALWKLQPEVYRDRYDKNMNPYNESSMIERFRRKAPLRHSSTPRRDDYAQWLILMQHYGLPTRLLDWTESPLIALYFALKEECKCKENEIAVFALSPYVLNQHTTKQRVLFIPEKEYVLSGIKQAFNHTSQKMPKDVLAFTPPQIDIRLMSQLSGFTIHNTNNPLQENEIYLKKYIIELESPRKKNEWGDREYWLELLKHFGITESSIFPDLEHLAKDIKKTDFKPI